MSQRDCGCPGLVTPTLDELLAVARGKPLPRVRVRERRPPPAKVGATLKGWLEWRLIDRKGREVRGGEGPNLILNQGLDEIAATELIFQAGISTPPTYFPLIRYAAVGTDSTAPSATQSGLGTEVARTDATYQTETITRPSPGVYRLTRYIEFGYDIGNGVLTEWGFSSTSAPGANLFNRALFTDSGGDPDAVTKTDQEKLRLAYTLEVALSPASMTPGSFALTNVGTVNGDYMLVGGPAPSSIGDRGKGPDLIVFSALARGELATVGTAGATPRGTGSASLDDSDRSGFLYTGMFEPASGTGNDMTPTPRDAYSAGSYKREGGAWIWDTPVGNLDPVRAAFINGPANSGTGGSQATQRVGYVFAIDTGDAFEKDNEHRLIIGVPTVTWGRA